jgi:hypothetical protein
MSLQIYQVGTNSIDSKTNNLDSKLIFMKENLKKAPKLHEAECMVPGKLFLMDGFQEGDSCPEDR